MSFPWKLGIERPELVKAGKFLLASAAVFAALNIVFLFIPIEILENFFAALSMLVLGVFGVTGEIVAGEPTTILLQNYELPITISYLCTGLLEMLVIVSVVAASLGIEARKRIAGIVAGIAAIIIFNTFRIVATILLILNANLEIAEIGHDLFFRVFLFIVIAGYYAVWFHWATANDAKKNCLESGA